MFVTKGQLMSVMLIHRNVNLKLDGEVHKYRYYYNTEKERGCWHCDDILVQDGMITDLVKSIYNKYKSIEITWKKQF